MGSETIRGLTPNAAIYFFTLATGACGLIYQVVWQRYLVRITGSDGAATATVLGVFLAGLALGYLACGRLTLRTRRLFRAYAALEAVIGVWALAFPWWFRAVETGTRSWSFEAPGGLVFQSTVVCSILFALPTLCMGGTVPLLTRALTLRRSDATSVHARVYATNTLGAVFGSLLAGFWLIYAFGLPATMRGAGAVNLAAAAFFFALDRAGYGLSRTPREAAASPAPRKALYAVAFSNGIAFMTFESLMIRVTRLSVGSTSYTFALVVAVFVLAIAVGSFAVALRRAPGARALFRVHVGICVSLMVLFVLLDELPWGAHVLRITFSGSPSAFVGYYASLFLGLAALLTLPAALMGAVLPLAFHELRGSVESVGDTAGTILAWNAAGSLVGGVAGGYLAFAFFDSGEVMLAVLLLCASAGWVSVGSGGSRAPGAGLLVAALGFAALFPSHDPLRFAVGTFRLRQPVEYSFSGSDRFYEKFYENRTVVAFRDAPEGTFAVVENPSPVAAIAAQFPDLLESVVGDRMDELSRLPPPRSIVVNGKSDSSTFYDRETLSLVAHIPALLSDTRREVLVIGLGTGVTAGELTLYDDIERIDVAEISSAVVDFLPHFAASTRSVHESDRLHVEIGDAFRVLGRSDRRWDIISSEPSNPWMTGTDQMFSREFYALVKAHLREGGAFMQWVQRYATNERILALALNTLRAEFPHVRVFRTDGTDDLVLATLRPITEEDFVRAARTLDDRPALGEALAAVGVSSIADLRRRERPDVLRAADAYDPGTTETLDRPRIHYLAGWAFFSGQSLEDAPPPVP